MPLSSSTLIHLTKDKDSLKGILLENFKIHYCRESVELADDVFTPRVPMVSFCDIPLSQIKDHIIKYGNYGIGLTKEWAQRSGLNPVLYVEPRSLLAKSYGTAFHELVLKQDGYSDGQRSIVDMLRYIKNYEGDLNRQGTTTPNYRYSDEREWRYVPPADAPCEMLIGDTDYNRERTRIDSSLESMRLEFTPNDIKYVIISSDDEISEFVELLHNAKGHKYCYKDVERLTTRLLTVEQIFQDV